VYERKREREREKRWHWIPGSGLAFLSQPLLPFSFGFVLSMSELESDTHQKILMNGEFLAKHT
jgi:hypothetical protein